MAPCYCVTLEYIPYNIPLIPNTKQSKTKPFSYSMGYTLPMTQYHGTMVLCHCRVYPIHYAPNTQYKTKHDRTIFIFYGIYLTVTQCHGTMLSCHSRVYPQKMPLIPNTKQSTTKSFSYSMGYTLPWHNIMPPCYHVTVEYIPYNMPLIPMALCMSLFQNYDRLQS